MAAGASSESPKLLLDRRVPVLLSYLQQRKSLATNAQVMKPEEHTMIAHPIDDAWNQPT